MENKLYTGTVSFVHHQKQYATIDYKEGEKKKTINFQTNVKDEIKTGVGTKDKKHHFRTGDTVNFHLKLTPRGDRMNAYDVKFLYNNELDKLIQKANIDNRFKGFLKMVDDTYFVKELSSYLFFPLVLSQWEIKPAEDTFNEAFEFRLINMSKQNVAAELIHPSFIPAFKTAMHLYKTKTPVEATVSRISPYAVYLNIVGKEMQAKLPVTAIESEKLKTGYTVKVMITYLGTNKIAVEKIP